MESRLLGFDDVLIEPQFSEVRSRKDVDVSTEFLGLDLSLPVINSNMDTVASPELCKALANYGMVGSLHRFWSIEENVEAFKKSISSKGRAPIVSIGIGDKELQRAQALKDAGASRFMLDVAHAANIAVTEMYDKLIDIVETPKGIIVGDFGTGSELHTFLKKVRMTPGAVKVGIGIGSVCHTRLVTGVGNYPISVLLDCAEVIEDWGHYGIDLILDGGVKHVGDIAKALVAGADIVMSGSLFAGTDEVSAKYFVDASGAREKVEYRGSACSGSYETQGKVADWRAPEGTSIWVPAKGPVIDVLNNINGGLRSSCSYVGAFNLQQLKAHGQFSFKHEIPSSI